MSSNTKNILNFTSKIIVFSVLCFLFFISIIFFLISIIEKNFTAIIICAVILILIFISGLFLIINISKMSKYGDLREGKIEDGFVRKSIRGKFKHIKGLSIAGNTQCEVLSYPSEYQFVSGAVKFKLAKNKVIDVSVKGDVDVQNQYVSSVGGAVVGGALFGTLGAAIGGRAKKKQIRTASIYLIITYKDSENVKYIIFDGTNALIKAWKFANEFKKNNTSVTNIEL